MSIATLQGITIPEGVVTQIADASGVVLWSASKPVVLQVEKITSDTYAGETTYTGEEFILLDIYPKTNGTVKVTYGGLTKTITDTSGAEEPNAQQVFFGTFNGVSDSAETPASGTQTIDGAYDNFAVGTYKIYNSSLDKEQSQYCSCITTVSEWGTIESVGTYAFYNCAALVLTSLPNSITSIGSYAFSGCTALVLTSLPNSITSIGSYAFSGCTALALTSLPNSITSIGSYAFYCCFGLQLNDNFFKEGLISIGQSAFDLSQTDYSGIDEEALRASLVITIPSTVTNIGENAFNGPIIGGIGYTYFKRVTVLATTPPTLSESSNVNIFDEPYATFTIVVPVGSGDAYKAANGWSEYADYIVEAS